MSRDRQAGLLQVEYLRPEDLRPYARNARQHPKAQVEHIAKSIERFGFGSPVIVSEDREVIAGHGRLAAAQKLGLERIPVVTLSNLTVAERRAYRLADNKSAETAQWSMEFVRIELEELVHLEFPEIEITGFESAEIERVDKRRSQKEHTRHRFAVKASRSEPVPTSPRKATVDRASRPAAAVSRSGDVWQLGTHQLVCGEATRVADEIISDFQERTTQAARLGQNGPTFNEVTRLRAKELRTQNRKEIGRSRRAM